MKKRSGVLGNTHGVLLLEVLVAIAILSVSLVAIIQSLLISLRGASSVVDYSQAIFLAENKMFQLVLPRFAEPSLESGHFDRPFEKFNYRVKKEEAVLPGHDGVIEIGLDVAWPGGKGERKISTATFILKDEKK